MIAVYVDELFVTSTNMNVVNDFKKEMARKFEMRDLGKFPLEGDEGSRFVNITKG